MLSGKQRHSFVLSFFSVCFEHACLPFWVITIYLGVDWFGLNLHGNLWLSYTRMVVSSKDEISWQHFLEEAFYTFGLPNTSGNSAPSALTLVMPPHTAPIPLYSVVFVFFRPRMCSSLRPMILLLLIFCYRRLWYQFSFCLENFQHMGFWFKNHFILPNYFLWQSIWLSLFISFEGFCFVLLVAFFFFFGCCFLKITTYDYLLGSSHMSFALHQFPVPHSIHLVRSSIMWQDLHWKVVHWF